MHFGLLDSQTQAGLDMTCDGRKLLLVIYKDLEMEM